MDDLGVALLVLLGEDRQGRDLALADPGSVGCGAGGRGGLLGGGGPGRVAVGAELGGRSLGALVGARLGARAALGVGQGVWVGLDVARLELPAAVRRSMATSVRSPVKFGPS